LKKHPLLRCAYPSSVNVLLKYASFLTIARALHLALFERPAQMDFFNGLLGERARPSGLSKTVEETSVGNRAVAAGSLGKRVSNRGRRHRIPRVEPWVLFPVPQRGQVFPDPGQDSAHEEAARRKENQAQKESGDQVICQGDVDDRTDIDSHFVLLLRVHP
jgi:hypothetical protein